jgi:DNA helicase-2/ATP-dependent DNA helicase PcrA
VIALAAERYDKDLWTERGAGARPLLLSVRDEADQARCVAERVLEHAERGMALRAQAVLFRSASHSAPAGARADPARDPVREVRRPALPRGGARQGRARDAALDRESAQPHRRVSCRTPDAPASAPVWRRGCSTRWGTPADPVDALRAFRVPPAAAEAWAGFVELLDALRGSAAEWPADVERIVRWYEPHLARAYDDAHVRRADLAQLAQIASTYPTRERFLTELTLDPPQATSDESGEGGDDDDYLILSTIHSAKGQEWKAVQVLNVVDGCIPSDLGTSTQAELEEERRLLYVAMTRAKDHLALLVPQRFYVTQQARGGDRHVYASRSRFIPDALLEHFDCCAWPVAAPAGAAARAAEPRAPIDLAARMRALWRQGL